MLDEQTFEYGDKPSMNNCKLHFFYVPWRKLLLSTILLLAGSALADPPSLRELARLRGLEIEAEKRKQAEEEAHRLEKQREEERKQAEEEARLKKKKELEAERKEPSKQKWEPEMIALPPNSFFMGCKPSEKGCKNREMPPHSISIEAFSIGKYEVTFAEWDACEQGNVCPHAEDQGWGRGRHPVINVSWQDVQTYIGWLNKQTGKRYRLPTEAEWEYAARAKTATAYWWGNEASHDYANYSSDRIIPVGQFPANNFNLHDLHGNVWEWTCSAYADYSVSYTGEENECADNTIGVRITRGGSWRHSPILMRSASRSEIKSDEKYDDLGFRLAMSKSSLPSSRN
jgi:formylglycine-generating enzyme required for sulfatase activity